MANIKINININNSYLTFVTYLTYMGYGETFVMWRNFGFLNTTNVDKSEISPQNLNKYISKSKQIHCKMKTNSFQNVDKYIAK